MGFFARVKGAAAVLRGINPAAAYSQTAQYAGFLQTPTSAAPDADALAETEQLDAVIARCVNVISEDCAQVPLKLFDYTDPKKPSEVTSHPAVTLFRHINPVETPTIFFQQAFADLLLEGNSFTWLDRDNTGTPIHMLRLRPQEVTVIPDTNSGKIISGYKWKRPDGKEETYDINEVMHIRTRNSESIYRGMGLLVRARDQIRFGRYLRVWKEAQFKQGIPTSLIFNVKRMFTDDSEWEAFREELWGRMRGVQNAGKPVFVRAEDVEIDVVPRPTEDEVAWKEALTYTRNEFAMLFGVPPSRLSDYSESFRATATEQARTYWQDTVMAWHRLMIDYLNSIFLPRYFYAEPALRFAYDYTQIRALAISMRDMASVNELLIRNGTRTPNEARVAFGDAASDDENADVLYMNGRPLGEKAAAPLAPDGTVPSGGEIETDPESNEEEETEDENGGEDNRAAWVNPKGSSSRGSGKEEPASPFLRAVPSNIIDEQKEAERLKKEVDGLIKEMVRRAGAEEIELGGLLASFDLKDPLVLDAIRRQSVLVSEATTSTTATEIRRAIANALEAGYDNNKLRKSIRATFKVLRADWRVDRIARTESHLAQEMGGYYALRQNGVEFKRWISSQDDKTRDDDRANHVALDGQVVPIDEPFIDPTSQAALMYPGDISGAQTPADVINCRCAKVADFSKILQESAQPQLWKSADYSKALADKQATLEKFTKIFKAYMRGYLRGLETRALKELDRQLGEERNLPGVKNYAAK